MHKRAFTLTELLVVVVIIGVLSAVVLPKFTKVIETRRTGEAESLLTAVRNEQEARCTLDKKYARNAANLNSIEGVSGPSFAYGKNYKFSLDSTGMTAKRTDKDYALKMKSYYEGKICCEGEYCSKLNKSYVDCKDYNPPTMADCAAPLAAEEGEISIEEEPCSPDYTHTEGQEETIPDGECTITRTWHYNDNPTVCKWEKTDVKDCPEPEPEPKTCDQSAKPATIQTCIPSEYTEECGTQTREVKCDESTNYEWQAPNWRTVLCTPTDECKTECGTITEANWSTCCVGENINWSACYRRCSKTIKDLSLEDDAPAQEPAGYYRFLVNGVDFDFLRPG